MHPHGQRQSQAPESPTANPATRFDTPQRTLQFEHGRLDLITVGGRVIGKGSFGPGWRWSHVAQAHPRPGGRAEIVGVVLSGRCKAATREAGEFDLMPGDFFHVPMHHDLGVVGYRPCEILYLDGIESLIAAFEAGTAA